MFEPVATRVADEPLLSPRLRVALRAADARLPGDARGEWSPSRLSSTPHRVERLPRRVVRRQQTYLAEPDADGDEARTLRPLQAAAVTYRIAFGPRAGHKVLTLRGAMPRATAPRQPLCADIDGFSLHAAACVEPDDRKRLEQLCR